MTNGLAAMIQFSMRQGAPIAHVAKQFDVDWGTVKWLDKIQLQHIFASINIDKVKHLIIDEYAVRKGHKYATVVMDAETHRVIWVGPGKSKKAMEPFIKWIRRKGLLKQIQTVSMDMNGQFSSWIKQHFPRAKILYDLFHIIQLFGREVIKKSKRQYCGRGKRKSMAEIKLLVIVKTYRENLQGYSQRPSVYGGKKICCDARETHGWDCVCRLLWIRLLSLEGANNKIKVLKRVAYGFRDFWYFRLRIMAALPGKRNNPMPSFMSSACYTHEGLRSCCFHTKT